jgi:uncharacterized membrane protein
MSTIGNIVFLVGLWLAPPAVRRWMLAMLGVAFVFIFTVGRTYADPNAVGAAAVDQDSGYFMTPLSWLAVIAFVIGLFLYPWVRRIGRKQIAVKRLAQYQAQAPVPVQIVRPPVDVDDTQVIPVIVPSATPDPERPDRPFYVPTVVGAGRAHYTEVGESGIIIQEKRSFDREVG